MTRSLRHRLARRGVSPYLRRAEPVISPYTDRLRAAAVGDHLCWRFPVLLTQEGR